MSQVAVIGGGIAGLTCAYELHKAGIAVEVFELEARVGGRMGTRSKNHLAFDVGANFLIRAYETVHRLASELNIPMRNASPVDHVVYRDGRPCLVSFSSVSDIFRIDGLNLWTRIKFLAFALKIRLEHPRLDFFDLSLIPPELNQEDAYSYAKREVGQEFADYIVDAFNSCMNFARSSEISSAAFLSLFSMMIDPAFDFSVEHAVGDMQAIPSAMADLLSVRTNCPVRDIQPKPGGWRVVSDQLNLECQQVVVATTAGAASKLLKNGPEPHRHLLSQMRYAATINVSFRIPREALGRTHCFYVPYVENQVISEFTNESLKGEHTTHHGWSLVNVGLHEVAAYELLSASDEEVFARVRSHLLRLNHDLSLIEEQVQPYDLQRWPEAIPKYDRHHIASVQDFLRHGQGRQGLYLCGDYLNGPWIEGASRSGQRVAHSILELSS